MSLLRYDISIICLNVTPPLSACVSMSRFYFKAIFLFTFYIFVLLKHPKQNFTHRNCLHIDEIQVFKKVIVSMSVSIPQISIWILIFISFLCYLWLHLCNQVKYVALNINLNLYGKKNPNTKSPLSWWHVYVALLMLLASECDKEHSILLICMNINFGFFLCLALEFKKTFSLMLFGTSSFFMFVCAVTPATHFVCLIVFQIICCSFVKHMPSWLPVLLIYYHMTYI